MNNWQFIIHILGVFVSSLGWLLTIIPPILLYYGAILLSSVFNIDKNFSIICCFGIVQVFVFVFVLKGDYDDLDSKYNCEYRKNKIELEKEIQSRERYLDHRNNELEREYAQLAKKLEQEIHNKERDLNQRQGELEKKYAQLCKELNRKVDLEKRMLQAKERKLLILLSSSTPFQSVARMISDIRMSVFDKSIHHLITKRNPASIAADEVRAMKKISSKIHKEHKEMEYKYEYILSNFPEIKSYIENDQDLIAIGEKASYNDLIEIRDRRQDYLSKEEYAKLSESEKSQLALDRYIARKKDKWQIGRDYEMSCAFQLVQKGYKVDLHGIKYGLKDLGRDLIAYREIGGVFGKEILIIQCKNWNSNMTIRENVIMQLYGSTTAYAIELGKDINIDIRAMLVIPPYTHISDTAASFAEKLNIRIERMENLDFPRIKCNINHGERIYHLPFDQLYDRTEIKNKDECYAYTVREAERMGFRRAQRHIF
ncbi:MAG: hypothetical protein HDS71_04440 [Bacteroidales bacterium]|nr:hypothetical protein [Bacteroidales bacterium]